MAVITLGNNSYATVSAAVAKASRGDTIVLPPGAATWSSTVTLNITKGLNLIGSGAGLTVLTSTNELIAVNPDLQAIDNEETIRIEGMTLDGGNFALNLITVQGAAAASTKPFKNLAIGHNIFRNMGNTTSGSGVIRVNGQVRGVIYNNTFSRCNVILKILGNDIETEWQNGNFPFAYGNSDNLFFEGNTILWPTTWTGGDPGWTETGQGARLVSRYNTWDMSHASGTELWDVHGFQNYHTGNDGQTGTMIVEMYGNTLTSTSGYRWINHRGSWGLYFNNIMTGGNGGSIGINEYGCTDEILGGTGAHLAEVNNTYVWNNMVNGVMHNMAIETPRCDIAEDLSFWNYNAAFDGSVGIGRGTSAPVSTATVGVAYWVCSTPTPTTDPNVIQGGHLWQCQATDVWTDYYTPYTYPHPLQTDTPPPLEQGPVILAGVPFE
jgi:hypothetical protein